MTLYENKVFDRDKPWLEVEDTEENILRDLRLHTLDPVFELYGNFVNLAPEWLSQEMAEARAGHVLISGNFLGFSHAFRVVTDNRALIDRFTKAIERNQATGKYQAARAKALAKVPVLEELTKAADIKPGKYLFQGRILTINHKWNSAYRWLAGEMGIPVEDCHFGYFDIHQLRQAYRILKRRCEQGL